MENVWRQIKSRFLQLVFAASWLVLYSSPVLATTNIQANVCGDFNGPSISSPSSAVETTDSSVVIEGTGDPGMTAVVVNNGTPSGSIAVTPGGAFALQVPLEVGDNLFVVRETDNCGTSKEATSEIIHRTALKEAPNPPQTEPPVVLSPDQSQAPSVLQPGVPTPTKDQGASNAKFPQPTISSPVSGVVVNGNRVWVVGRAEAKSTITIYTNGQPLAYVIASDRSGYGALVAIKSGKNTIQVRSEANGMSSLSRSIEVTFTSKAGADPSDSVAVRVFKTVAGTTAAVVTMGGGGWAISRIRLRWFR